MRLVFTRGGVRESALSASLTGRGGALGPSFSPARGRFRMPSASSLCSPRQLVPPTPGAAAPPRLRPLPFPEDDGPPRVAEPRPAPRPRPVILNLGTPPRNARCPVGHGLLRREAVPNDRRTLPHTQLRPSREQLTPQTQMPTSKTDTAATHTSCAATPPTARAANPTANAVSRRRRRSCCRGDRFGQMSGTVRRPLLTSPHTGGDRLRHGSRRRSDHAPNKRRRRCIKFNAHSTDAVDLRQQAPPPPTQLLPPPPPPMPPQSAAVRTRHRAPLPVSLPPAQAQTQATQLRTWHTRPPPPTTRCTLVRHRRRPQAPPRRHKRNRR